MINIESNYRQKIARPYSPSPMTFYRKIASDSLDAHSLPFLKCALIPAGALTPCRHYLSLHS